MPGRSKQGDSNQPKLDELISLAKAAELSGLSQRHLRHILSKGDMWGKKMGRDWFTTVQAVRDYLARERRPGPKPQKNT